MATERPRFSDDLDRTIGVSVTPGRMWRPVISTPARVESAARIYCERLLRDAGHDDPRGHDQGDGAMLFGPRTATLQGVYVVTIHGQPNYRLEFTLDDAPDAVHSAQLADVSVHDAPKPGDRVTISFVAGQAVEVRRTDL